MPAFTLRRRVPAVDDAGSLRLTRADDRPARDTVGDAACGGEARGGTTDDAAACAVASRLQRLALLRTLRDRAVPLTLRPAGAGAASAPGLTATLQAVHAEADRVQLRVPGDAVASAALLPHGNVEAEAVLDGVRLGFGLPGLQAAGVPGGTLWQAPLPARMQRWQRRESFRVEPPPALVAPGDARVHLRHPSWPEMQLSLPLLDVSAGGCALWLPDDVPPLPPGTRLGAVAVALDAATRFDAALTLLHLGTFFAAKPRSAGDTGNAADTGNAGNAGDAAIAGAAGAAGQGRHRGRAGDAVDAAHPQRPGDATDVDPGARSGGLRVGCAWHLSTPAAERLLQRWIDQAQRLRRPPVAAS